jgi:hypothetical protein
LKFYIIPLFFVFINPKIEGQTGNLFAVQVGGLLLGSYVSTEMLPSAEAHAKEGPNSCGAQAMELTEDEWVGELTKNENVCHT